MVETSGNGVEKSDAGQSSATPNLVPPIICILNFWPKKVAFWFYMIEAQFTARKVTDDYIKFNYVICALAPEHIDQVEQIISAPPETNKYGTLKDELLKLANWELEVRTKEVLEQEELGDRTPSQFWRHLHTLANAAVPEKALIELWSSRLPVQMQQILASIPDQQMPKLREIADRIHGVSSNSDRVPGAAPAPAAASTSTAEALLANLAIMKKCLMDIKKEVIALSRNEHRSRNQCRGRSRSSPRPYSRNRQ